MHTFPSVLWRAGVLAACVNVAAQAQSPAEAAASEATPQQAASAPVPGTAPALAATPRVTPGVWIVMGSSSALGVGGGPGRGWSALLRAHMHEQGVSLLNLAKSGATSYAGLSVKQPPPIADRPPPDTEINIDTALILQPRLILISYPSNDTANGYAVEETLGNILSISQQAAQRRIPVLVVSTQPRRLPAEQLARMAVLDAQLRRAFGACCVDVQPVLAGPDGQFAKEVDAGDGIHPNVLGHERIYAEVLRVLDSQSCVRLGKP